MMQREEIAFAQSLRDEGYSLDEVAEALGRSQNTIMYNTVTPANHRKLRKDLIARGKPAIQNPQMRGSNTHLVGKGVAKVRRNDRVFETRTPREERKVIIDDKTYVMVRMDDKRTDEQIRNNFIKKHNLL